MFEASVEVTLPVPPPAEMRFEIASKIDWNPCVDTLPILRIDAPLTTVESVCEITLTAWASDVARPSTLVAAALAVEACVSTDTICAEIETTLADSTEWSCERTLTC